MRPLSLSACTCIVLWTFLKDQVEAIFNGNLLLVGAMLCITALLCWSPLKVLTTVI